LFIRKKGLPLARINYFIFFIMNIYVGNIPYRLSEEDLKELFQEYGTVESVKIITDKFSGRSKGFGFVEMPNEEEAKQAIEGLNETEVEGRPLRVNEAKPREY